MSASFIFQGENMSTSLATHLTATDLHSPVLKPRILVIDDDVDMGDLLYRNLPLQYRCHVDVAADPFEAINMMTERFYDLIVLDWNMPAFDGGEILKKPLNPWPMSLSCLLNGIIKMFQL